MDFCDVVPKEWVDKWSKQINRHPLGTGPFVFQHWTAGREIVLTRNPHYWEEGKPYLDDIDYALSFSPSTALLKLQHGEMDVLGDAIPPSDIVRIQNDPEWKDYVYTQPLVAISYMFLNDDMKPFDNPKVREAIAGPSTATTSSSSRPVRRMSALPVLSAGHAGPSGGQGQYYGYDPGQGQVPPRRGRLPGRLRDDAVHGQRRPEPEALQSVQADLTAIGIEADLKTMGNNSLLHQQSTPGC